MTHQCRREEIKAERAERGVTGEQVGAIEV